MSWGLRKGIGEERRPRFSFFQFFFGRSSIYFSLLAVAVVVAVVVVGSRRSRIGLQSFYRRGKKRKLFYYFLIIFSFGGWMLGEEGGSLFLESNQIEWIRRHSEKGGYGGNEGVEYAVSVLILFVFLWYFFGGCIGRWVRIGECPFPFFSSSFLFLFFLFFFFWFFKLVGGFSRTYAKGSFELDVVEK